MLIVHECCCGMLVRPDGVIASVFGPLGKESRTFATSDTSLKNLGDWLEHAAVQVVAGDGTGALLLRLRGVLKDRGIRFVQVDAREVRHLPGRSPDMLEAEWFALLLRHGLLDEKQTSMRRRKRRVRLLAGVVVIQLGLVCWSLSCEVPPTFDALSPAAPAQAPESVSSRTSRGVPEKRAHPEYNRLMVYDVVVGLLLMEKEGPESLRLTAMQKKRLREISPRLLERMRASDRSSSSLDAETRSCLSDDQLTYISDRFNDLKVPRDLGPQCTAFEALIQP